jgi:hypothetical protein
MPNGDIPDKIGATLCDRCGVFMWGEEVEYALCKTCHGNWREQPTGTMSRTVHVGVDFGGDHA